MSRTRFLLAGAVAIALALSPGLADARAGSGSSFGSRGSMTYSAPPRTNTAPYSAAPMERSMSPQSQPYNSPGDGAQANTRRSSGFMSGLMGGLIGAGIGGLLFGHGFMGGGLGGFGFLGLLLQIFLVVWIGRWLFRMFMGGRSPAMAGGPNIFARGGMPGTGPVQGGAAPGGAPPIAISLTDVNLVSGDLAQSWTEQGRDYATVAMRFSMIDVTRDGTGRVVDGSPNEHVTATEIWTFVRSRGGHWILSAIQQARSVDASGSS